MDSSERSQQLTELTKRLQTDQDSVKGSEIMDVFFNDDLTAEQISADCERMLSILESSGVIVGQLISMTEEPYMSILAMTQGKQSVVTVMQAAAKLALGLLRVRQLTPQSKGGVQ